MAILKFRIVAVSLFTLTVLTVDNEDEGQYEIEENCSKSNRVTYAEENGAWIFHFIVLSPYSNWASALIIVTTTDLFDGINSDQLKNKTLSTTAHSSTVINLEHTPSVPIYIIPVIIGAVGIINLIGCLKWGKRRKIHMTKGKQHNPQGECDPGLYLTPTSLEPPLSVPSCQEGKPSNSNIAQNKIIDPCTRSIHLAQTLTKDGYEVVYFSNNDDPEITPEQEEITYESTENCNTRYSDTSGYLIVLGRRESTV